ncbi:terminase family protein [Rhizobium sp. AG855]|uniref:DNA-packaging protein n=1 Tax=Rhizobium sp. AG855 TaxID=2183898 RepID=UPI000FF0557B|nr:terminase family protein [Rhizobium sp. AG855]RKE85531.1 phage terminase large subunit-like protein [Rhizobium sp. AG855]
MTPKSLGRLARDRAAKRLTSAFAMAGDLQAGLVGISETLQTTVAHGTALQEQASPETRAQAGFSIGTERDGRDGRRDRPVSAGRSDVFDLTGLTAADLACLARDWRLLARPEQLPPEGDWRHWLILGGRGSGKTRAGAEWVQAEVQAAGRRTDLRIALVAETLGDAREVMIDGASGLARIARRMRPVVEISRRRLVWPNGAIAQIFSSEDPESLRGPQFHLAWCDELAKWKHADETFDMLQFALRLGEKPRQVVTTTPRPVPLLKRLMADEATRLTRIATAANAAHLAPGFLQALAARYGGTRLGRQELDGELIEDRPDALWKRGRLDEIVVKLAEPLRRIVVAVDPPAGGAQACCGIVVAGLKDNGQAVVLSDCSVEGTGPATWARAVVSAYRRFEADRVVAEVNQGGDMVKSVLESVEARLPVTTVRATRGKFLRAEPVAALYEQGRVLHAGRFSALEDQMCDFGVDGLSNGRSPDRLDALVWALTALMLEGGAEPRIRGV